MEDLNRISRYDDHTHSYFSSIRLIDSINSPETILLTENQLGLKGCCLTDHEFVGGHLKFLEAAKKLKEEGKIDKDFKAALGNEIYLVDDRHNIDKYFHHILNAKNTEGEKALRELSSIAWINGYNSRGMMRVPTERKELERIVKKYPNSLISTPACIRRTRQCIY